jgi:hypothetical protein
MADRAGLAALGYPWSGPIRVRQGFRIDGDAVWFAVLVLQWWPMTRGAKTLLRWRP